MVDGVTVGELINLLSAFNEGARVMLSSPDGGYVDIGQLLQFNVELFVNHFPGAGPHDVAQAACRDVVTAVIIPPAVDSPGS